MGANIVRSTIHVASVDMLVDTFPQCGAYGRSMIQQYTLWLRVDCDAVMDLPLRNSCCAKAIHHSISMEANNLGWHFQEKSDP